MPRLAPRPLLAALAAIAFMAPAAESAVVFNFTYADAAGTGFNDAALGAARRGALEDVANNYIGTLLDYNSAADINVTSGNFGTNNFLATAGSSYFLNQGRDERGLVQQHIIDGTNFTGNEGSLNANFSFNYYYGADPAGITSGQSDFRSVVLHELTHALGFAGLLEETGNDLNQSAISGTFSNFDEFLVRADGTKLLDLSDADYDAAIRNNNVQFAGANSVAANGGTRPGIFAPDPFVDGSSLSHWAQSGPVMFRAITNGTTNRQYSNLDLAALRDLGYDLVPVPEPTSLALLGLAGVALLRRRGNA